MVEFRWKQYDPVNILNMELAEFDLTKTEYSIEEVEYVGGIDRFYQRGYMGGVDTVGIPLPLEYITWVREFRQVLKNLIIPEYRSLTTKYRDFILQGRAREDLSPVAKKVVRTPLTSLGNA